MPQACRPTARTTPAEVSAPSKPTVMEFIKGRLCEMSTWRALVRLAAAFGVFAMTPDQEEALIAIAMILTGTGGLMPDRMKP